MFRGEFFDLRLSLLRAGPGGVAFHESQETRTAATGVTGALALIVLGKALEDVHCDACVERTIGALKDVGVPGFGRINHDLIDRGRLFFIPARARRASAVKIMEIKTRQTIALTLG